MSSLSEFCEKTKTYWLFVYAKLKSEQVTIFHMSLQLSYHETAKIKTYWDIRIQIRAKWMFTRFQSWSPETPVAPYSGPWFPQRPASVMSKSLCIANLRFLQHLHSDWPNPTNQTKSYLVNENLPAFVWFYIEVFFIFLAFDLILYLLHFGSQTTWWFSYTVKSNNSTGPHCPGHPIN